MENDKFKINIQIGGYNVPLEVCRKDELIYRDAEKTVKALYNALHKKYPPKSVEELWMLTAFQIAVKINSEKLAGELNALDNILECLEKEIDAVL